MNNELKIRLAETLGLDYLYRKEYDDFLVSPDEGFDYIFTPETDYKLFHDCLIEIYTNGFQLLKSMDSQFYCYDHVYTSYTTSYFDTPEEAVYTAFCEMMENKND